MKIDGKRLKWAVKRLMSHPLLFTKNVFRKLITGPAKYSTDDGYEVQNYWKDRLGKYRFSFRGVGDEGLSEKENRAHYREAGDRILECLANQNVNMRNAKFLDIGVGTGYYTQLLYDKGVKDYTGFDITNVLFTELRQRFPEYKFNQADITSDTIAGEYDVVLMIDVVEHIVKKEDFTHAMSVISEALNDDGGVFIISGLADRTERLLFYTHAWTAKDVRDHFPHCIAKGPFPFRGNKLFILRKK